MFPIYKSDLSAAKIIFEMRERELLTERGSKDEGGMDEGEEMYVTSMLILNFMLSAQTLCSISSPLLSLNHCPLTFSLIQPLPSCE